MVICIPNLLCHWNAKMLKKISNKSYFATTPQSSRVNKNFEMSHKTHKIICDPCAKVSLWKFTPVIVLPQLSSESCAYSLLCEFINVCADLGNNVSEFCTPVRVDAVSECCSVDTFLQTTSHHSTLCKSNTVVNDDLIVPDSQDSYGSVEIPYPSDGDILDIFRTFYFTTHIILNLNKTKNVAKVGL